jgi:hypothetical protein
MSQQQQLKFARRTIDRLRELDQQTHAAYYEMGQLLSTIKHGEMHKWLGYDSFAHLVEEELSFTSGTAHRYASTYQHFKRLGYNKTESLKLMNEFGITDMSEYLPSAKNKVGVRAIKARIDERRAKQKEITFWMTAEDHQVVLKALKKCGCTVHDSGKLNNSSIALVNLSKMVVEGKRPDLYLVKQLARRA